MQKELKLSAIGFMAIVFFLIGLLFQLSSVKIISAVIAVIVYNAKLGISIRTEKANKLVLSVIIAASFVMLAIALV